MVKIKKVMIMAGGTGGHVFPGIALARAFEPHDIETHWLGTKGGLESNWVQQAGIPFSSIGIKGLRGNGLKGWLLAPVSIARAFWQARRIMQQQQPDLVVGMGGFVCGPGGLAARSLGIPLVLHEQNAIPGMTNKWLAPFAIKVFCGFEQTVWSSNKAEVIGNPIRQEIEAIPALAGNFKAKILIVGGSRGARVLNQMVPQALALLPAYQRPVVLHQTGLSEEQATIEAYRELGVEAEVCAFIHDMAQAYRQSSLVISRSGALTISELMAAARPAILVPFPFAVDDHQTANAQVMVKHDAATLVPQAELTPERLAKVIQGWLLTPGRISQASSTLNQVANKGTAEHFVQRVLELTSS